MKNFGMRNVVVVFGAGGALGRKVLQTFSKNDWLAISVKNPLSSSHSERASCIAQEDKSLLADSLADVERQIHSSGGRVGAVINVAGGFKMDNAADESLVSNYGEMVSSSLSSSILSARIAAKYLTRGGLLVLPGASAALNPTPWAVSYGACKAAVHHLVGSLAKEGSGMPEGSRTVGIAPVMLDTPANRLAMPEADVKDWTPLEAVAETILSWASSPPSPSNVPENGAIYKIVTKNGITQFLKV